MAQDHYTTKCGHVRTLVGVVPSMPALLADGVEGVPTVALGSGPGVGLGKVDRHDQLAGLEASLSQRRLAVFAQSVG